jgi:hypothetical protein
MNLCFTTIDRNNFIDFPFQTPTSLTYEVYGNETKEGQLSILVNYMKTCNWDSNTIDKVTKQCKELLFDPTLKLSII